MVEGRRRTWAAILGMAMSGVAAQAAGPGICADPSEGIEVGGACRGLARLGALGVPVVVQTVPGGALGAALVDRAQTLALLGVVREYVTRMGGTTGSIQVDRGVVEARVAPYRERVPDAGHGSDLVGRALDEARDALARPGPQVSIDPWSLLALDADRSLALAGREFGPRFTDVPPGHWAYQAVHETAHLGFWDGFPDW